MGRCTLFLIFLFFCCCSGPPRPLAFPSSDTEFPQPRKEYVTLQEAVPAHWVRAGKDVPAARVAKPKFIDDKERSFDPQGEHALIIPPDSQQLSIGDLPFKDFSLNKMSDKKVKPKIIFL